MAKINSKNKGSNSERELAKILNERFGEGFKRTPYSGAIFGQSNRHFGNGMSDEQKATLSGDIMTPPDFRFVIEHKAYKEASFWDLFNTSSDFKKWFIQVSGDAAFVGKEPLLIVKFNNKKRIVFSKEKISGYVFEIDQWYCYWLEEFLKNDTTFFYSNS